MLKAGGALAKAENWPNAALKRVLPINEPLCACLR